MEEQQETSVWLDSESQILTRIQLALCDMIMESKSDEEINDIFDLKSKSNIGTCMRSTLSGNIWSPGRTTGGPHGYLSDVEASLLIKLINERGNDMDCVKTIEAIQITYNCRQFRYTRSLEISKHLGRQCSPSKSVNRLIRTLEVYVPTQSWLTHFCQSHNINIKNPVILEVATFFIHHHKLIIITNPLLIWNTD